METPITNHNETPNESKVVFCKKSMATADSNDVLDDDQLCCMEATVVSGFEECARGEAKEKFNTDVKAVRGKITWKIPIHRVEEVITMGSIDNCRVVMTSIPHFGFTEDQYDSLARLQKLVGEFDWDGGLRVWRKFNEFPHPIPPKPDVVPSPDELVDVVIAKPRDQSNNKSSKEKKNKKGGRGKKKERRTFKAQGDAGNKHSGENGSEAEANTECKHDNDNEAVDNDAPSVSVDENGTKKVVIKRLDPNEPSPKIEIKVLIPGPNESVFPTDVDDKDQRDEEPMDVDHSMHQNPDNSLTKSPMKSTASPSKSQNDESENIQESELSQPNSHASPFKQPSAAINILSSAKDFASSVIEKLTSAPQIPSNDLSTPQFPPKVKDLSCSPSCVTPPPTPVQHYLDFFMKSKTDSNVMSTSVDDGSALSVDGNTADTVSSNSLTSIPSTSVDNAEILVKQADEITESDDNATAHAKPESLLDDGEKSSPPSLTPTKDPSTAEDETLKGEKDGANATPMKKERDPTKPTFRVTCNRVGVNHAFDSSSAAASLGSAIITYFNWSVDLKNFDIEVLLNIDNEEVTVSLGITKTSLHNRNMVAFGPTTLRATICYNMLRLCRIRNGDFVCDPMCGTSAIPIEGSLKWMNCFHFGGDYHELGISRSMENISAIQKKRLEEKRDTLKIGTVQWNIEHFPLRDQSVDVFVSDLPFGYRMGSRVTNRTLYPTLLSAMARTARMGARACLLTEDKTSLIKALQTMGKFWQRRVTLNINMGGLSGYVFLLTRTTQAYSAPTQTEKTGKTAETLEASVDNSTPKLEECQENLECIESLNEAVPNVEANKESPTEKLTVEKETLKETQLEGGDCKD